MALHWDALKLNLEGDEGKAKLEDMQDEKTKRKKKKKKKAREDAITEAAIPKLSLEPRKRSVYKNPHSPLALPPAPTVEHPRARQTSSCLSPSSAGPCAFKKFQTFNGPVFGDASFQNGHAVHVQTSTASSYHNPGALAASASVLKPEHSPEGGVKSNQGSPGKPQVPSSPGVRAVSPPGPRRCEETEPKYMHSSRREPELGSQPGNYVDPGGPWRPAVTQERDGLRRELEKPIPGGPYDRVLAVPAHVLAQSMYHPDQPSAQARVKELQKELKVVREDKRLQHNRALQSEKELERVQKQLQVALHENAVAKAHIMALREQVVLSQIQPLPSTSPTRDTGHAQRKRPQSAALPRRLHSTPVYQRKSMYLEAAASRPTTATMRASADEASNRPSSSFLAAPVDPHKPAPRTATSLALQFLSYITPSEKAVAAAAAAKEAKEKEEKAKNPLLSLGMDEGEASSVDTNMRQSTSGN